MKQDSRQPGDPGGPPPLRECFQDTIFQSKQSQPANLLPSRDDKIAPEPAGCPRP